MVLMAIVWVDLLLLVNLLLLQEYENRGGKVSSAINRIPIVSDIAMDLVGKQKKEELEEVGGVITSELEKDKAYFLNIGLNDDAVVSLRESSTVWDGVRVVGRREIVGKKVRVLYFKKDRVETEIYEAIAAQKIIIE